MQGFDFSEYRRDSIGRFRRIVDANQKGACDEQGLPSYLNSNLLMRWLVWKRVEIVINAIKKYGPYQNALDFGCGYGVFLPFLNMHSQTTFAYDLIIDKVKTACQGYQWKNIIYISDLNELTSKRKSLDLILAIEVLEHIENTEEISSMFADLLSPNGHLLVAGPTENWIYKIGRKLAGYSGEYHVQNIYDIIQVLAKRYKIKKISTLVPGLPFFEVYDCTII